MRGLISVILFLSVGCVTAQGIEDGIYSAADCSITTSLSCATMAIGGCILPSVNGPGNGWKLYADCHWDRAKECERAGLARCALAGAVEAAGFPGLGRSSGSLIMLETHATVPGYRCDVDTVRSCVSDARIESKSEAIATVAYCFRHVCKVGE